MEQLLGYSFIAIVMSILAVFYISRLWHMFIKLRNFIRLRRAMNKARAALQGRKLAECVKRWKTERKASAEVKSVEFSVDSDSASSRSSDSASSSAASVASSQSQEQSEPASSDLSAISERRDSSGSGSQGSDRDGGQEEVVR